MDEFIAFRRFMRLRIWLYRLQQRLSITTHESIAVVTLLGLFVLGLTVQHVREQHTPPLAVDSLAAKSSDQAAAAPTSGAPTPETPVHLNGASAQQLQALDGIGPALSERIVEYRTTQHPFERPEELTRVRGIGPKTLAELRPLVTVSAPDE